MRESNDGAQNSFPQSQGGTKPEKRIRIQSFLKGLIAPLDLMCGQEHKLRASNIGCLNALWPTAIFLISPAQDGANARRKQRVPTGCGGVFLVVGPSLRGLIVGRGITPSGRVV